MGGHAPGPARSDPIDHGRGPAWIAPDIAPDEENVPVAHLDAPEVFQIRA
ncbi:hypothetical protein AIOL_003035 [Candidatus Rhodobacter oscarellae]|uniref:Uncharacterized protein n=1 Tax=Candidatus Rhodobacter oscarellae TaxID=1675527 RepID=A0A0J9E5N2_9RHOB|nr:hypothetical protein AIOL_003035 [Candidatus Rhodobacter lobularis]